MLGPISKKQLILVLLFLTPSFSFASVSKIVFVTDVQTIKPNDLSGAITFQTQDSSGNALPTTETLDLEFISNSASGLFLGSTGNPTTKTMSTNTTNRTFYYKDSTEGSYTLTINAIGRTSQQHYSASQNIIISSVVSNTSTTTNTTTNAQTDSSQNSNSTLSSHSNPVDISGYKPPEKLAVTIGRNRLTTVNALTEFGASSNIPTSNVFYHWSFGDGASADGQKVEHSYDYPGDYVVVLNAEYFGEISVSRIVVKVVEPKFNIVEANNNYIKIKNDSNYEANLYGWKLFYKGVSFAFPVDTILLANSSADFSSRITGFHPIDLEEIRLSIKDKEDMVVMPIKSPTASTNQLARIYTEAIEIKKTLDTMNTKENTINIPNIATPITAISNASSTIKIGWLDTLKRFLFKRN